MSAAAAQTPVLLDGNVLVAIADAAHIHHDCTTDWLVAGKRPFATCPITQRTLLRMLLQFKAVADVAAAVAFLREFTAHRRHVFWADELSYLDVQWKGVMGQRQVTDAYLCALARRHGGRMATLDRGLAALHEDVAELIAIS